MSRCKIFTYYYTELDHNDIIRLYRNNFLKISEKHRERKIVMIFFVWCNNVPVSPAPLQIAPTSI